MHLKRSNVFVFFIALQWLESKQIISLQDSNIKRCSRFYVDLQTRLSMMTVVVMVEWIQYICVCVGRGRMNETDLSRSLGPWQVIVLYEVFKPGGKIGHNSSGSQIKCSLEVIFIVQHPYVNLQPEHSTHAVNTYKQKQTGHCLRIYRQPSLTLQFWDIFLTIVVVWKCANYNRLRCCTSPYVRHSESKSLILHPFNYFH